MTSLHLAILSLTRRKVPTLIALSAIAISVACSGILLKLYHLSGARFSTIGAGGDAVVGAKAGGIEILLGSLNAEGDYPGFLPYKLYESLKTDQTVRFEDGQESKPSYLSSVIPILFFGKYQEYRVMGTDESFLNRPKTEDSLSLAAGKWVSSNLEVVIGSQIANQSGFKLGDEIPITPWIGKTPTNQPITFRIVGILKSTGSVWDRMLYSSVKQAQATLQLTNLNDHSIWGNNVLNYFLIYLKPNGLSTLESLINRRTVAQVISIPKELKRLEQLTGTGRSLGFLMTSFIMLLGALSVTAMLVTRFEAMSVQFAVLRAMGYAKKEVGSWLLWEGFILGAVACLIGGLADAAFFPFLRSMIGNALPSPEIVSISFLQSLPIWISAIGATMFSVFIPLFRLYQQDVHFSLKGV